MKKIAAVCGVLLLAFVIPASAKVARHATADCSRFALKFDEQSGKWNCVYKTKNNKNKSLGPLQEADRNLKRLKKLKAAVDERVLQTIKLSEDLRKQQIKLSTELLQLQRKLVNDLNNAHLQRRMAITQQGLELRRRQEAITQQLLVEQRQRLNELRQASEALARQQQNLSKSLARRRDRLR